MVDYYSNFIDVAPLASESTASVIRPLKADIARFGIMSTLVIDNGPQFVSQEFDEFTQK